MESLLGSLTAPQPQMESSLRWTPCSDFLAENLHKCRFWLPTQSFEEIARIKSLLPSLRVFFPSKATSISMQVSLARMFGRARILKRVHLILSFDPASLHSGTKITSCLSQMQLLNIQVKSVCVMMIPSFWLVQVGKIYDALQF